MRRIHHLTRLSLPLLLLLCDWAVATTDQTAKDAAPPDVLEFKLPLDQGRLNLRDVLSKLAGVLGMQPGEALNNLNWSIDVQSVLGRIQLRVFDRLSGGIVSTEVQNDSVVVKVNRSALEAKLAQTGRSLEHWLANLSGTAQAQQAASSNFGLTFITSSSVRAPAAELSNPPKRAVILVHGLDDPGFMWGDLLPELQKAGYFIGRFDYPNDGPIGDAADLLAAALADARKSGIEHVDIIAHSMGGLVARDVLTRAAYYHGDGSGGDGAPIRNAPRMGTPRYPSIDRLIMLGTPNHGSAMARLRGVTEIGEHLYRALTGQSNGSPSSIGDGSGEAGVDLLPESDFLRRLNDRPLASHTKHTIITGQWSPVGSAELNAVIEKARRLAESDHAPQWLREWASEKNGRMASSLLTSAIDGLGDGCVTLESAKLKGVDDFVVVQANHVNMLMEIGTSKKTPPAVPIILVRLK